MLIEFAWLLPSEKTTQISFSKTNTFYEASLVAQLVKNLPAMQETWVQSLGGEDPLEKGKATHSSILAWRIPWSIVHGVTKSQTRLSAFTSTFIYHGLPWWLRW